jgi:hypothetical protein
VSDQRRPRTAGFVVALGTYCPENKLKVGGTEGGRRDVPSALDRTRYLGGRTALAAGVGAV